MRKIQYGLKYEGKRWAVMTRNTETSYDSLMLPRQEKMVITIIRNCSEAERRKYHRDTLHIGKIKYSEWKKLR